MKKRILSMLLCLCMMLTLFPSTAFAEGSEEPAETPVCTCETACTADAMNADCPICGAEGAQPADCGKWEAPIAETTVPVTENPTEEKSDEESPAEEPTAVQKVQSLIDALPDADTITAENRADVEAQLTAIDDAKLLLTDAELDTLDFTKYNAAIAALDALDGQSGASELNTLETGSYTDLQNLLNGGGTVTLDKDYSIDQTLTISGTVILDLNGHVLKMTGNDSVIKVNGNGGKLTLEDNGPTAEHKFDKTNDLWVLAADSAAGDNIVTVTGGIITGGNVMQQSGGGVYVGGSFTMTGGSIVGCTARSGGGVYAGGNFTMNGGSIVGCTATYGGGVYMSGSFTMSGGSIENCTATGDNSDGGGVLVNKNSFALCNGTIRNCKAGRNGGGVYVNYSSSSNTNFTMSGGSIENCTANKGGNVYVNSCDDPSCTFNTSFTMSGGTVTGDTGTGGVHLGYDDNVYGCTMYANGGTVNDTVYVSGPGTITNNSTTGGCTTFNDPVTNYGSINGGTYNDAVTNNGTINGGVFYSTVSGTGTIADSARWTVTFDLNGVTGTIDAQKILKGQKAAKPTDPTQTGYDFGGWYTDADCTTAFDFDTTITGNITLYARWIQVDYSWYTADTSATEFIISDAADLLGFANLVNGTNLPADVSEHVTFSGKTVKLANDIDLTSIDWTPIGREGATFQGTFDGGEHKISNLYYNGDGSTDYNRLGTDYIGLFGYIDGGKVKNVTVADSHIENTYFVTYVGGVVGFIYSGTMENCHNSGSDVKGTSSSLHSYVGGIAGSSYSGRIDHCTVSAAEVNGIATNSDSAAVVGGIVGDVNGTTVTRCANSAVVSATNSSGMGSANRILVGGIVGLNSGTVSLCTNSGKVSGTCTNNEEVSAIGGVVGYNNESATTKNSYNTGDVSGSGHDECCGGVVGYNYKATVNNCYSIGAVSGGSTVGGVLGCDDESKGNIANCYYKDTAETDSFDGTTYKTADDFKSGEVAYLLQSTAADAGDGQVWGQRIDTDDYPVFATANGGNKVYQVTFKVDGNSTVKYLNGGAITVADPTAPDGYIFGGWFTAATGGTQVTEITEDIILYAKWTHTAHTGGTATCQAKAICEVCHEPYGELGTHDFTIENKDATGALKTAGDCQHEAVYYKSCSVCGTVSTSDMDTFNGDKDPNTHTGTLGDWQKDENGHWKVYDCCPTVKGAEGVHSFDDGKCECGAVMYTVTFDANRGSVDTASATTDIYGKLTELPTPTRSGSYRFDGWFIEKDGGAAVTTDTVFTGNATVYAHWSYIGGSDYTYCTIKATAGEGGSISPSGSTSVRYGSSKTFTITPNSGYAIADVKIDGQSIGAVTSYTFGNVKTDHTIKAVFMKATGNPQTGVDVPFTDVSENDWFYEDVAYVYEKSLMNGTGETTFGPDVTTTRGMIVTILYRLEGEPSVSGNCPFEDVKAGSYCEKAIIWAEENDIVSGYGNDKFGSDDPITREQMAVILYRYAQYKKLDVSVGEDTNILSYNDAPDISEYAFSAVQWICGEGIMKGSDGNLMPQGNATRAQVAALLHRFCEEILK